MIHCRSSRDSHHTPQHTRNHLESLHSNISVFRHPDHTPTGYDLAKDLTASFKNFSLNAASIAKTSVDTLRAIYGTSDGMVLFWAHHEKLCVIDEKVAFMGGLDMCKSAAGPCHDDSADRF